MATTFRNLRSVRDPVAPGRSDGQAVTEPGRRAFLIEQLRRAASRRNRRPLSFAQERLWFLEQFNPNTPLYNISSVVRLRGTLDVSALEESLNAIVARHESLRTRFTSTDGEPAQIVEPLPENKAKAREDSGVFELGRQDLMDIAEAERECEAQRRIQEEVERPFDLGKDRLFRANLLRLKSDEHVLIATMHHIVSDEWSFRIFYSELATFYARSVRGEPVSFPSLPIQYRDYALWQREWLKGPEYKQQLDFWKKQLQGNPGALELPADHSCQSTPRFFGAVHTRPLRGELADALKELAHREGVTLFILLLAAFKVLLYRYTGQQDIIVGSPMSGRNRLETEEVIGLFVNTLPLRSRPSGALRFEEFLQSVREVAVGAFANQDLPFEKIVEALQPERSINRMPFVNVMFWVQPGHSEPPVFPGLELEFLDHGTGTAKFDLSLAITETPEGFSAGIEYSTALFEQATITRLLEHYENLLQGIVAQPSARLAELPLLSSSERRQILVEWNKTSTDYPRARSVHELFEEQARARSETVAVVLGKSRLTYGQLNSRANQLAHYLRYHGVEPGMKVALFAERSLEMIISLLGILKAGAAYAALDLAAPKARLAQMLQDLRPAVLLTQHRLLEQLPPPGALGNVEPAAPNLPQTASSRANACRTIWLDSEWKQISRQSGEDLRSETATDDLAYVSFTSGSTGLPKGVCVPHRGVIRLVRNTNYISFLPEDAFLQMAPVSFDASTFEIWGALLNGARLVLYPPQIPTVSELAEFIGKHGITVAWFTSGLFNQIAEAEPAALKPLRQILTGGDVLSPTHIRKALSVVGEGRLINGYGPTENTTFTTCYAIPASFDGQRSIPIGRPISNTTCYILDPYLQPAPIGVPGELYAGGDGLAEGYLNAPELTREKFIAHPFQPGARLYKTGDLARYLADGNIEFLGRIDSQVKVRGFRVEPGEVESTLLQHPAVRRCAVVARADSGGTKQLVAYVVPAGNPAPPTSHLQHFLRERLPDYMVPALITHVKDLPLSRNGKVDRRALSNNGPGGQLATASAKTGDSRLEPRDDLERQLRDLWEQVLQVRPVGLQDRFFALGGHSLLAVRLLALIQKRFGKQLTVATLFQNPTIEQLAAILRGRGSPKVDSAIVEIQPGGSRPPLLLVHGAGGGMFWGYSNLARHLGTDQPVFAFKSRGLEGREELQTVEELAETYLADLRAFQPTGPYYLGGYCFGGVVAYEMARRLRSAGEEVPFLGLINSSPPNSSYGTFRWTPVSAGKFATNILLRTFYLLWFHPEKLREFLRWKFCAVARRLGTLAPVSKTKRAEDSFDAEDWIDLSQYPEDQRRVWQTHLRALAAYHPPVYPGRLTLFRSPVHLLYCSFDPQYGWGELAQGGVTVKVIPGAHETIMEEPGVQGLASAFRECLMH